MGEEGESGGDEEESPFLFQIFKMCGETPKPETVIFGCVVGVVRRCISVVAMERRSLQSDVSRLHII